MVGGASGIGRAVVDRLRGVGQKVLVWDLVGGDITCDISDPDSVAAYSRERLTLELARATGLLDHPKTGD